MVSMKSCPVDFIFYFGRDFKDWIQLPDPNVSKESVPQPWILATTWMLYMYDICGSVKFSQFWFLVGLDKL